jgi:hypothetical protein
MSPTFESCPSAGTVMAKPRRRHGGLRRRLSSLVGAFKHETNRVVVPNPTASAEQASHDQTLLTSDQTTSIPLGDNSRSDSEAAVTSPQPRPTLGRRFSSTLRLLMRRTNTDPKVDAVTTVVVEEQVAQSASELHSMAALMAKNAELEATKRGLRRK